MSGRFIAICGPSGVGKDSVMEALVAADPRFVLARRVITRPGDAGGEAFDGVDATEFAVREVAGEFALHWPAHGMMYAIPKAVDGDLAAGKDVLANLSRAALPEAMARFERVEVILLTTNRAALAARLAARGRESAQEIEKRLDRADFAMPEGIAHHVIDNSAALEQTVKTVLARLYPVRA